MSTYHEALEQANQMKGFEGLRIVIRRGSDSDNSFYPDYEECRGMAHPIVSSTERQIREHLFLPKEKGVSITPNGRTDKQHKLILSLNKKKRF